MERQRRCTALLLSVGYLYSIGLYAAESRDYFIDGPRSSEQVLQHPPPVVHSVDEEKRIAQLATTASETPVAADPKHSESVPAADMQRQSAAPQGPTSWPGWLDNPILAAILGAVLASGLLGAVWLVVSRKRAAKSDDEAAEERPWVYTPPGLLEDPHGVTNKHTYDITGKLTWISRAPGNDSAHVRTVVIRDDTISRDHALIQYRDLGYWISDRGSANGTFVNGEKITHETLLKHGDNLRFAQFEFKFLMPQREDLPDTLFVGAENSPTRTHADQG